MSRDTTVLPFRQPEAIDDPLTEVAREGARRMLAQVLIAEADAFVAIIKALKEHAAGLSAADVCRKHGISDATFYKWRSRFGGMEISDARKLEG
jgi:Transposase